MKDRREASGGNLWQLFTGMLSISAFTFGGGFVIVTLMKRKFVDERHWLTEQEMLDMTALAQSSPGAIAVNAAILVGWKAAGLAGMLVAVLGTILPPMVILTVISLGYQAFAGSRYVALVLRGMQSGVAAVILDAALSLGRHVAEGGQRIHLLIMAGAFVSAFFLKVNVIWIVLFAGAAGAVLALCRRGGDAP